MSDKLKLWFFRDLSDEQRLKLFGLFGLPTEEIGATHGRQEIALRHIMQSLIKMVANEPATPSPESHSSVEQIASAMEDSPFVDDIHMQGTSQQHMRAQHYASIAHAVLSPAPVPHLRSDVDRVAHVLTGHINGVCCHKTGGYVDDPKCECREIARDILAVFTPSPETNLRWIEWAGGDFLPVPPEMHVTVLLRDGSIEGPSPAREFGGEESCWKHRGADGDIVAYTSDLLFSQPAPQPSGEPRCGVIGWPPLKKAIWDQVIATNLNGGKYISAWDVTERIYAAAIAATTEGSAE